MASGSSRRAERVERHELRSISPIINQVLDRSEVVLAGAQAHRTSKLRWKAIFGVLGGWNERPYWIAVTERRVIFLRYTAFARPKLERVVARKNVILSGTRSLPLSQALELGVLGLSGRVEEVYRLSFFERNGLLQDYCGA